MLWGEYPSTSTILHFYYILRNAYFGRNAHMKQAVIQSYQSLCTGWALFQISWRYERSMLYTLLFGEALWIQEFISTLPKETEDIWNRPITLLSVLFLTNRYAMLISATFTIYINFGFSVVSDQRSVEECFCTGMAPALILYAFSCTIFTITSYIFGMITVVTTSCMYTWAS